jgi:hypothetical protein
VAIVRPSSPPNRTQNALISITSRLKPQMRKRVSLFCWAVGAVIAVRLYGDFLRPREAHAMLKAMPGAAIFGVYAAAAATYIAMAIRHVSKHKSWRSVLTRHSLLFLVVAGFCLDYVLNNYAEIDSKKNGSYGLVVLIDFVTWGFIWAIPVLHFPRHGRDYKESSIAILVPTLTIFRQMAHAREPLHVGAATVDLLVGMAFAAAWILLPHFDERGFYPRLTRATKFVLIAGCLYGALLLIENFASHFLGLEMAVFRDSRIATFWLNVGVVVASVAFATYLFRPPLKEFETLFAGPCSSKINSKFHPLPETKFRAIAGHDQKVLRKGNRSSGIRRDFHVRQLLRIVEARKP